MRNWLQVFVGASIMLTQTNMASAKSPVEINRIARSITVRIDGSSGKGSGILLQHQGNVYTVLTAGHVLKGDSFTITTPDDRQYPTIINSDQRVVGDVDLGIIKFQSNQNYPLAHLGDSDRLEGGMELYVAGFPTPTEVISQSVFVFRPGRVTANSNKVFNHGYALLYNNDTLPGMSGGPIINEDGQVVGVHGRGDREVKTKAKTGFNAGISISRFVALASSVGVKLQQVARIQPVNNGLKADDYFVAAYQHSENGDIAKALAAYDRAISLDPNYATAYNNRGILKEEKLQDVTGALADYNRSIAIQPRFAVAFNNRGKLKRDRLSDFRGALADYSQAIILDNSYAQAYYNRGVLYKENFIEADAAIRDFQQAARLFREQELPEDLTEVLKQLQELEATE
jgi:Trypsin-like peptidase domain/TPR repeat